jgi:hypothetical protein
MNGVIICNPPGSKFGNATMSFLHAYAHAQRVGAEFLCPEWIGEKVFSLPAYRRPAPGLKLPQRSEMDLGDDETNVEIRGYAQHQRAMIYTKTQAQEWLKPKYPDGEVLKYFHQSPWQKVSAHLRRGDFIGYNYPLISLSSYDRAISVHNLNAHLKEDFERFCLVSELSPQLGAGWVPGPSFLVDFTILRTSAIMLRANSSFSWVAGLLSKGRVFSPIIDQLEGGKEHNCDFVEGNWPRLSNLDGCTDLHVKP